MLKFQITKPLQIIWTIFKLVKKTGSDSAILGKKESPIDSTELNFDSIPGVVIIFSGPRPVSLSRAELKQYQPHHHDQDPEPDGSNGGAFVEKKVSDNECKQHFHLFDGLDIGAYRHGVGSGTEPGGERGTEPEADKPLPVRPKSVSMMKISILKRLLNCSVKTWLNKFVT